MPETQADRKNLSPGSPNNPRPLLQRDEAEFCQYQLLDSLTMSLAILTNMMSAFVYYRKHI
jgi:hypothetical protein